MCAPLILAGLAIASTAASMYGQAQQAKATQKAAVENYNAQIQQTQLQERQINAQSTQEQQQRSQAAQAAESRMMTAAGESGVAGISTDRSYNEIASVASQDISTMESNRTMKIDQAQQEAKGYRSQAQGTVNTHKGPGNLAAGLQIVGSGVSAYSVAGGKFGS